MTIKEMKLLDQICEPESRQFIFVKLDPKTGEYRPNKENYSAINNINLEESGLEDVRNHINTSCNILICAWFIYKFISVAYLHTYASLEFALNARIRKQFRDYILAAEVVYNETAIGGVFARCQ